MTLCDPEGTERRSSRITQNQPIVTFKVNEIDNGTTILNKFQSGHSGY